MGAPSYQERTSAGGEVASVSPALGSPFLAWYPAVRLPVGALISPHLSWRPPVELGHPWGEEAEDSEVEREGAPCMGGAVNSSAGLRGRTDPSSGEPENW